MSSDNDFTGSLGVIIIFSFVSTLILFFSILFIAVINNYALGDLYNLVNDYVANNLIPSSYSTIADAIANVTPTILPYADYLWFGAFLSMILTTLIYSYNRKRENFFSLLNMAVLGIIIITYIGSYFIQITEWFRDEIFFKILPTISTYTPIFTWYLENIGVINLVLIITNIVVNFVDFDFKNFVKRKEDEKFDEI